MAGVELKQLKGRFTVRQQETPLFSALMRHVQGKPLQYHVPGHKGGRAAWSGLLEAWGDQVFAYDLTELDSLDDLHAPGGVIREAELLAAAAFGAQRTHFLTAGATAGIIASVMACCKPGDKVLLPRNVHRSVIAAVILVDAYPVFMQPEFDDLAGVYTGLVPQTVEDHLRAYPEATLLVLVNPTYHGACGDIADLVDCARERGVPVLVDEAHGSHFPFYREFPPSGLAVGADLVVHAVHKTLGALTGGAMVHMGRESRVPERRLRSALRLVHTTSPSYLTMASLDAARMQAVTRPAAQWSHALALAHEVRRAASLTEGFLPHPPRFPRPGYVAQDPLKVVLVSDGRWRGQDLARALTGLGHYPELTGDNHVLLVMGVGDQASAKDLVNALAMVVSVPGPGTGTQVSCVPKTIPPVAMRPRQAAFSQWRTLPLEKAGGLVAGEMIVPYPPGVAVICPGELITAEMVGFLMDLLSRGHSAHGIGPPPDYLVSVVEE
ncbi:MAG: aminotransferase class I/II-fold pyridoxal phosphate-dependent enzyme [Bacillota bacterium]